MPSVLEVFSYSFTHFSASVGIFFEYRDYICWIKETEEYAEMKSAWALISGTKYYAVCLICSVIHLWAKPRFPLDHLYDPEFAEYGFFYQFYYMEGIWL